MARSAFFLIVTLLVTPQQPSAQQAAGAASGGAALDYEVFKTRVQPILMSPRKGNARCVACHATGGGNSYLEPLPPGATTYTDEQTRRNFERVARLVTPGEPLKSILLTNPLAEEAGGSHWHGGGKHWQSQNDAEWQTLASWVRTRSTSGIPPAAAPPRAASASSAAASPLDYEVFKTRVQPILMSPRKGNARCVACHATGGGNSYLEPLPPGATTYTDEQTRRNFERVARLVTPGDPLKSILLTNPLAEEAGGSHWHGGGKHWQSQNDPEWQTLAAWARGGRP
jgi:uncharacterized membrane protein